MSATSLGAAGPASADAIAAKRRQAARLADAIDALGEQESILDEDFNSATIELARLRHEVARAKAAVRSSEGKLSRTQERARARALRAYTDPTGSLSITTGAEDLGQAEHRRVLRSIASGEDASVLEDMRADRQDVSTRQKAVLRAQAAEGRVSKGLAAKRTETAALLRREQKLLDQTKGELGALIAAEEKRRAAAEAARAKAELVRRQAAALAAYEKAAAKAARDAASQSARDKLRRGAQPFDPRKSAARAGAAAAAGSDPLALPDVGNEPPVTPGAATAIAFARTQLGKPYQWGAAGPNAYDCSGLLLQAWRSAGRSLPHSSRALYAMTSHIPVSAVRPGDLVFYGQPIHHVGMYVGNGEMIESPRTGLTVRISSIFHRNLVGVGRL